MYDKIHYKLKKKVGARKTPLSFRVENLHNNGNYLCLSDKETLEKGMAVHSSILALEIPWTKELGGLQSMELQRTGYD